MATNPDFEKLLSDKDGKTKADKQIVDQQPIIQVN